MKKPKFTTETHLNELLMALDKEYYRLHDAHYRAAPKNNSIPVGGGDWMDTFFKMEAIRGAMGAIRSGKSVKEAIEDGKVLSEIAIQIWNTKREYQVHRWEQCCHHFIESLMTRLTSSTFSNVGGR